VSRAKQMFMEQKNTLLADLRKAGVGSVFIEYDGYDDCSVVEEPEFKDSTGRVISVSVIPKKLLGRTREFLGSVISQRHDGYDAGAGGYGNIEWNIDGDNVCHCHNDRIEIGDEVVRDELTVHGGWESKPETIISKGFEGHAVKPQADLDTLAGLMLDVVEV
jgi:hypothetical protein